MGSTVETMSNALRMKRLRLRLRLEDVARKIGVHKTAVSAWERGARVPTKEHVRAWKRALAGGAR